MRFLPRLLRIAFITSVAFIVCVTLIAAIACFRASPGLAIVTVVNQSEETIDLLRVEVNGKLGSGELDMITNMRRGEERVIQFPVSSETYYHIHVISLSGRKIWKDVGYLHPGSKTTDIVSITEGDIELTETSSDIRGRFLRCLDNLGRIKRVLKIIVHEIYQTYQIYNEEGSD